MNEIIKIILFNILFLLILYYDKRVSLIFIVLMIIYWVTIYSNMRNKMVEGMDLYFRDIFYMPETDDKCEYGAVLPNSIEYNSDYGKYSTMYSFYKGMGHKNMVESKYNTLYNETNKILDELIDMLEKKKSDCEGKFTREKCSKECGLGYNKVTYKINSDIYDDSKCDYKNGETYYEECVLRDCEEGDECSVDNDCRNGRCIDSKCSTLFDCDKDMFLDNCRTEKDCLNLNEKYKDGKFKYNWDGKKCSSTSRIDYKGGYDDSKKTIDNVTGLDIKKTNEISIGSSPKTKISSTTRAPTTTPTPTEEDCENYINKICSVLIGTDDCVNKCNRIIDSEGNDNAKSNCGKYLSSSINNVCSEVLCTISHSLFKKLAKDNPGLLQNKIKECNSITDEDNCNSVVISNNQKCRWIS